MKYMILHHASQAGFASMAGKDGPEGRGWTPEELAALGEFMAKWTGQLVVSGEFVDALGLAAPVHTRRVVTANGETVVTDGPYAETAEVVAGITIIDCASFDRATEIAAQLKDAPLPEHFRHHGYVDVRPVMNGLEELTA